MFLPFVLDVHRLGRAFSPSHASSSLGVVALVAVVGCSNPSSLHPAARSVHSLANQCVSLSIATEKGERYLVPSNADAGFAFKGRSLETASRFHARPSDLGVYIFRDVDGAYPVSEGGGVARTSTLYSDTLLNDDAYVSPAEWELEETPEVEGRFRLFNRASQTYLGGNGLTPDKSRAARVAMSDTDACAAFPELTVDATGSVTKTHFPDGDLFGIVDAHSHMFTNVGFGGGGTFHGAPFHRLGVEHALPDCEPFHGGEGRHDILGYFYGGGGAFDQTTATNAILTGETPEFDHFTAGYPEFTEWPNSWNSSTHQTQYYRWIERAYLSGLRLIVQHATSNQVLCELVTGVHAQQLRTSCNEMFSAERTIDEVYALERYIDAQSGGPGLGWFRVVTTPAEARQVIGAGKLAVVLGIETSNLFDCYSMPHAGFATCDAASVRATLDHFHERGVRVMFPVHKFDNAFSAGDGNRGFIELGNVLNSGHYSNFTTTCPANVPAVFDHGNLQFGGMNSPRADYFGPADVDVTHFADDTIGTLFQLSNLIDTTPAVGNYCQNAGLTTLGETLILEMMKRGMIIEIDHLPQLSYQRAVQMLMTNDYPAAGTHGSTANGTLYALGGISVMGLPRCGSTTNPEGPVNSVRARIAAISAQGGYPAQGFGFDLNGFAGGPRPRFGVDAPCSEAQGNPITYPFTSYAGDVTFEEPHLGNRTVDFNDEGMIHLGLVPELIEDARHIGVTDADLEPLFRSAEGYIRMWERAELRGAAVAAANP